MGVAGPLQIIGDHINDSVYVPMATTEGAIVTTYHTGMRMVNNSGGVKVFTKNNHSHITPMFEMKNMDEARSFQAWIKDNHKAIKEVAERTTRHGKLLDLETHYWDQHVLVEFVYSTGDAQGMNMVNVATEAACEYIRKATGVNVFVRSNYSGVKKMSNHNLSRTFGREVFAEAVIPKKELKKLRVTAPDVARIWHSSFSICSKSNTMGINCQAANGIAAIFLACGQDMADISSSHLAYTNLTVANDDDLRVEVYVPNLVIGTIGGGIGLGSQSEALKILGCYGSGNVERFAEIIGSVVLAGELATACAIVNGTFVKAHAALGRNRP